MKTKHIDFHTHTTYSDGELSPKQVVRFSALSGNSILAITDHDNIRGYFEAKEAAKQYGINLISGVEITTPRYHLLALNFNPEDKSLQSFIEHSRELQKERCKTRVEILQKEGLPITIERIEEEYPHSRLGKGNIKEIFYRDKKCRNYLREKHPTLSPSEIFRHYLGRSGVAGDPKPRIGVTPKEAIDIVHKAGGIIGIAHPPKDIKEMKELEILVMQGIDFLEVQPNLKAKYDYQKFEDFAERNNLPISFGSDYHGPTMDRKLLEQGENILTESMAKLLNITQ